MTVELQKIADTLQGALTDLHFTRIADQATGKGAVMLWPDQCEKFFAARDRIGRLHARLLKEIAHESAERQAIDDSRERECQPVYASGPWPGAR